MPMTPEERNRRRREQYAAGKAQGLNRSQLRSAKKAVEQAPDLMDVISNLFSGITKGFQEVVSDVAQAVEGVLPGNDVSPPTSKGAARSGGSRGGSSGGPAARGGRSKGGGSGAGAPRKGGGKKPPKPPAKKKPSAAGDFKKFAARELKKNPKASSRELEKKFKEKTGKRIGHAGAQAAIREAKGQPERNTKKINKFTEKIGDKEYAGTIRKGIKYFQPDRNPQKKTYIKGSYMYVVKYGMEREGFAELSTEYITISSNRQLSQDEINDAVMDAIGEGMERGKKVDKYKAGAIREDTIEVLYAIDNRKK